MPWQVYNSAGQLLQATDLPDDAVTIAKLAATGTASNSTFLRGDNTWQTVSGGGSGGGNGSGNNTGSWSPPTLSLDITELVDHGSATNYSIEFSIDDMDYNSTYSWAFFLLNESMDIVFEEEVQSVTGNTSVSIDCLLYTSDAADE